MGQTSKDYVKEYNMSINKQLMDLPDDFRERVMNAAFWCFEQHYSKDLNEFFEDFLFSLKEHGEAKFSQEELEWALNEALKLETN